MFRMGNHFALALLIVGGFFVLPPRTAQAQFIVSPQVAPTIGVVPVRRGLFGMRTGFVPVFAQPVVPVFAQPVVSPVAVMRPMVVSNSVSFAPPMASQSMVTVGRPVVGFATPAVGFATPVVGFAAPVTVARPVITNSWTAARPVVTGPVVVSRPVIVNQPVFAPVFSPVPVQTVLMPAW